MLVQPIPKLATKKNNHRNEFSKKVKEKEFKDANGKCRRCQGAPIQHYHHANEKGMGGGRGLSIQINCIGLCNICHNHDDIEFLRWSDKEMGERIDSEFRGYTLYSSAEIAEKLQMDVDEVIRQQMKGFLDTINGKSYKVMYVSSKYDIQRWLMGKGVR